MFFLKTIWTNELKQSWFMMVRSSLATILRNGILAILLFLCLFVDGEVGKSWAFVIFIFKVFEVIVAYPETQWMLFGCAITYAGTLFFLHFWKHRELFRSNNPILWLTSMLLIGGFLYAKELVSTQALIFFMGASIGQSLSLCIGSEVRDQKYQKTLNLLVMLVFAQSFASICHVRGGAIYEYYHHVRFSGPWANPNMFGSLMAIGFILLGGVGL